MTSIRIAIASALTLAAVLAGGAEAHHLATSAHSAATHLSHVVADSSASVGGIGCCKD